MKRLITILITTVILFCSFSTAAYAAESTKTAEKTKIGTFLDRMEAVDELCRLIQTETKATFTFEQKVCVALTVLHRVDSPKYPDNVIDVIYQPHQYSQPSTKKISDINLAAAEYAIRIWEDGTSYDILPKQYLYFSHEEKKNSFHDFRGNYYDPPKIEITQEQIEEFNAPYSEGGH